MIQDRVVCRNTALSKYDRIERELGGDGVATVHLAAPLERLGLP